MQRTPPAVRLAITGDTPYDAIGDTTELERLRRDVAALSGVDFLVHLGDLKTGSTPCRASTYTNVAEALCPSGVPAFVLPGDNEWNDCERTRDEGFDTIEGWRHWDAAFGPSADRCGPLTPPTDWGVRAQVRPEQPWWPGTHTGGFRFDRQGVRFVGLALPSFMARGHGLPGERGRKVQALAMSGLAEALDQAPQSVQAAVVLLHADVLRRGSQQQTFVEALRSTAGTFARPVLVVVGDSHSYASSRPFEGIDLTYVVITRGGAEAPLHVEIRPRDPEPFTLIRGGSR